LTCGLDCWRARRFPGAAKLADGGRPPVMRATREHPRPGCRRL